MPPLNDLEPGDLIVIEKYVFAENTGAQPERKYAYVLEPPRKARTAFAGAEPGFVCGLFTTNTEEFKPLQIHPAQDYRYIDAKKTVMPFVQIRPISFARLGTDNVEKFGELCVKDRRELASEVLHWMYETKNLLKGRPWLVRAEHHCLDTWLGL